MRLFSKKRQIVLLISILSVCMLANAQDTSKTEKENKVKSDFAKLAGLAPSRLAPFYVAGKWGYFDIRTKRIIVNPDYQSLSFFTPGASGELDQSLSFTFDLKTGKLEFNWRNISLYDNQGADMVAVNLPDEEYAPAMNPSYTGPNGFIVDEKGKIVAFNPVYSRYSPAFFNMMGPFKINGILYAIAHKPDFSGIIDQHGNPLPGFDFNFKELVVLPESDDNLKWFYYVDKDGVKGFISESGKRKLHGMINDYPLYSSNRFGYAIQSDAARGLFGVLDIVKKEWLIKPQKKIIMEIVFSSGEKVENIDSWESRKKVNLLFSFHENERVLYLDIKGRIISPDSQKLSAFELAATKEELTTKPEVQETPAIMVVDQSGAEESGSLPEEKGPPADELVSAHSAGEKESKTATNIKEYKIEKSTGYEDINILFRDFPKILRSKNWNDITDFCRKILPDEGTISFMRARNFSYRGLPDALDKMPDALEYINVSYLNNIVRFRADLERNNQLKDLEFVKIETEGTETLNKDAGIEFTETFIILKSGTNQLNCKLGEMIKINGVWKSFTEPKLGW